MNEAASLPAWFQILISLSPWAAVAWAVFRDGRKISLEEADRRKREVDEEVQKRLKPYIDEQGRLRQAMADEKRECKETTDKLEARLVRTEDRLHTSEGEKNKLGTKVAGLEGQLKTIDRFLPKIDVMLGGRRAYDPESPDGESRPST